MNKLALLTKGAMAILLASAITSAGAKTQEKPNVLFIAIDDLRVQYGPYDLDQAITPNLDQLMNEGVAFTQAYSNVPVCGASRASVFTGVRPTIKRFVAFNSADKDAPWAPSIAQTFKESGYTALSLGKVFNNITDHQSAWSEKPWRPEGVKNEDSTTGNKKQSVLLSRHDYLTKASISMAKKGIKNHPAFEKADVSDDAYKNGKIAARAIEDLQRLKNANKPFFLAVGLTKPHLPFNAPNKYWQMYDEKNIQLSQTPNMPDKAPKQAQHQWNELRNYGHDGAMAKKGNMSDEMARKLIHGYYAATSYSDALVGNILAELKSLNLADNTIVVIWGDHGWSLGEHSQWAKHSSFDVANHIPLIIKAPGMSKGQFAQGLVESVDIYPTLTALAGIKSPETLQGDSLVPMLKDTKAKVNTAVFPRWKNADSIRTEQFLFTQWRNPKNNQVIARMLFDHSVDKSETKNVVEHPDYTEVVNQLQQQLADHIAQVEQ